jgi:hypothetical protein
MKFSAIKCASIVALTVFALTAHDAVAQQPRLAPGVQAVKPNDTTLPERVNALQAEVNLLSAEVKSLQKQLATFATSHSLDEANAKINKVLLWVNNYGTAAQNAGVWVSDWGKAAADVTKDYKYGHVHQFCYHDPVKGGAESCRMTEGPSK